MAIPFSRSSPTFDKGQLMERFNNIDLDHDEVISTCEGQYQLYPFGSYDTDSNLEVTLEEFCVFFENKFQLVDTDGDLYISEEEFWVDQSQKYSFMTREVSDSIFEFGDWNKDNKLSFTEYNR